MAAGAPILDPLAAVEGPWIEIIRKMEALYADLARMEEAAERRTAELLRAKAFADNVIGNIASALLVTDQEGRITAINEAGCELLGPTEAELVGQPLTVIFAAGAANPLASALAAWRRGQVSWRVTNFETRLKTSTGAEIPVSLNLSLMRDPRGDLLGAVLVATDLRESQRLLAEARAAAAAEREQAARLALAYEELKTLQARLIQSEKMTSLGRMAASVAHEINNPLGGIVAYSHLVLETVPADFAGRPNLEKIVREALRCRDIVRRLLDFARPGQGVRLPVDLHAVIHASYDLLQGQAGFQDIKVAFDLAAGPLSVRGDAGQLQQVFTNLLVNAAEALGGRGVITIRSWLETAPAGVAVSVTDPGCGMAPETLARLFEPFFTTKQGGHGTGLGLAIVYGIIERHRGTIKVVSSPGQGTTFTLFLPAAASPEASP